MAGLEQSLKADPMDSRSDLLCGFDDSLPFPNEDEKCSRVFSPASELPALARTSGELLQPDTRDCL